MSASSSVVAGGGDGNPIWKFATGILATMVLGLVGCIWQSNRDVLQKADLIPMQRQLDEHSQTLRDLSASQNETNRDLGEVKGALGIPIRPR